MIVNEFFLNYGIHGQGVLSYGAVNLGIAHYYGRGDSVMKDQEVCHQGERILSELAAHWNYCLLLRLLINCLRGRLSIGLLAGSVLKILKSNHDSCYVVKSSFKRRVL